ncbi:MAG: iron-sulfur cluster repair di-iron protein [Candidatus Eremiobacteraeota bacterium]|nr:iron-sulfur cluster repair di-iron protein [Candidatus Eremiobacteraeota bacterium]
MKIDVQEQLGKLVIENPSFVPILEEYRLDFCCQGKQTLAEACKHKGIDLTEVVTRLSSVQGDEGSMAWEGASLKDLITHIQKTYHEPLHAGLVGLQEKANKVARVHGSNHPELVRVRELVETLSADLLQHTRKEDAVLFPWICSLERGEGHRRGVDAPISMMEAEHEEAGAILEDLRATTKDYQPPEEACTTYRLLFSSLEQLERDTHLHIHLENSILFPKALALTSS